MATSTWSTDTLDGTDAQFRIWGKELSDKLQAMSATPGLVKTADTGQINWTTVTRAAASTDAGYEIYYLNDSLHATAPIYFRLAYGSGANSQYPRLRLTVGTGTDGAGTITGTCLTTVVAVTSNDVAGNAAVCASYLCVATGFLGLAWKVSTSNTPQAFFAICRSCDADGTPNAKAAIVVTPYTYTHSQVLRFEAVAGTRTKDTTNGALSLVPQGETSSAVGANLQAYMCWMSCPDVRPIFGLACIVIASHGLATTFSVALVGSTARTYVALNAISTGSPACKNAIYALAMLYE